jgi:CBS domain-containing protein
MSIRVKDVMAKNIITIGALSTVRKAVELMDKYEIGCLIVMHKDKPIGIVTERDLLTRVLLELRDPRKTKVRSIMSKPLVTANPETNIHEAIGLMVKRKIKKLPVTKKGRLRGLVTLTDIVRSSAYFEHVISSFIQRKCAKCKWRQPERKTVMLQSSV